MAIRPRAVVLRAAAMFAAGAMAHAAAAAPVPGHDRTGHGDLNLAPRRAEVAAPYVGELAPGGAVAIVRDGARRAPELQKAPAGLPPIADWALMIVGVSMIGAALRGFMVANRAIARLQPEEME